MFLHVNIMHIVFNMLALWQVGLVLESRLGKFKFAVIYFLSGISGGLLSVYMNEPMAFSIGASGAVFGLFGAYVAISRRLNADANGMLVMIAINLSLGFVVPNIDWHGHVGGLVAGFLLGNLVELRRR
jgi:membrane associated rhomboid family serine protease